jgi:two-component system KDP operon response regulator KdpE
MSRVGPLVLVVEDEVPLRKFIRASLSSHQFRIIEAERAAEVAPLVTSHNPDIVLMDLGLPDGDGIDVTRQLRAWTRVPIIIISARGREDDKVTALDAGADDYLTKPFGVNELLARMRVALRHAEGTGAPEAPQVFEFGDLKIDLAKRIVMRANAELHLTPTEYKLLSLFARNAGKVLTYKYIMANIWSPRNAAQIHTVRVHMAELRRKVDPDASHPLFVTEPGVGYRLREGGDPLTCQVLRRD